MTDFAAGSTTPRDQENPWQILLREIESDPNVRIGHLPTPYHHDSIYDRLLGTTTPTPGPPGETPERGENT